MLNKNIIFLIISIFLGFIISFFYIRNFDISFVFSFIIITLIIYLLFYYLGNINNKENFTDYYNSNFYNSKFFNTQYETVNNNTLRNSIEDVEEEESNNQASTTQASTTQASTPQYESLQEESLEEEEQATMNVTPPVTALTPVMPSGININPQGYTTPDVNKILMENPIPNSGNYGPLNINISYNAQNSVNEIDNQKNIDMPHRGQFKEKQNVSKNLGNFNDGRIYSNDDWIYGNNAWTDFPDYYIPNKNTNLLNDQNYPVNNISQTLNEVINTKKYKSGDVAPLMVNTPWSEYKSGDDSPEAYNI
jgi:hypothetical protein